MAPKQRKSSSGSAKDKESKKDDQGSEQKKEPTFMEKHILKVQLLLMLVAFLFSVVPRIIQGHDRYNFDDSYKDPVAWYRQFAKDYASLFGSWNYSLHVNTTERLHRLFAEAGADVADLRVLDVGAGSGLVGLELQRLGYKHTVGTDVVEEILLEANSTGAYERVLTTDAEAVPVEALENASFDAVLCVGTAGYLGRGEREENVPALDRGRESTGPEAEASRVDKLLQEWLRLLKPGGILGFTLEALLKGSWEAALHTLVQDGKLVHLDTVGPMDFLPGNGWTGTSEKKAYMYFHRKHA